MGSKGESERRRKGVIKVCGPENAAMLHDLSVETYVDTFDGTSSDEDMQKYLDETYAESVLRKELENPNSVCFVISMPADSTSAQADDSAKSGKVAGSGDSDNPAEIPAGYMKLNFGDAQIEDMGPNAMEVQRLYIQKAFKGCGLGTQLMNKALGMARERGLKKVWLGVWEHNEPAKRFYAGKGFVRVGQHDFWQGDDKQTDYLMAMDL